MTAPRHPLRKHIIALFRSGDLVSLREAELICDASRKTIWRWLKAERIDIEARRLVRITRLRATAQRIIDGKPARLRLTKAQHRAMGERLVREFREKHRGSRSV